MSTKTTIKRIALVAVSTLGMGLLSVVPASAGIGNITGGAVVVNSIIAEPVSSFKIPFTLTTTAAITVGDTAGVTVSTVSAPSGATITCSQTAAGAHSTANCTTANTVYATVANTNAADSKLERTAGDTKIVTGWIWAKVNKPGTYVITVSVVAEDGAAGALTKTSANKTFALTSVPTVPTYTNTTTTIAGRVGQQVSIPITADLAANDLSAVADGEYQVLGTAAAITSQPAVPAGSAIVYPVLTSTAEGANALKYDKTVTGDGTGSSTNVAVQYLASNLSDENMASRTNFAVGTVTFTPVSTGVYTLVVWNETSDTTTALSGSESYQTFTINVTSSIATVSMTAINSTCAKDASLTGDDYGCLVKVQLKDAAGNLAIPATGEAVVLTPSSKGDITYVNGAVVSSAAGAAYSLSAADFGNTGTAWINTTSTDAETYTVVATYTGSASASVSITTRTVTAASDLSPLPIGTSGFVNVTGGTAANSAANFPRGSATGTFSTAITYAASTYGAVLITDTKGAITGVDGSASFASAADLKWAPASTVSTDTDGAGTDGATFSVSWTASSSADTASIFDITTLAGTYYYTRVASIATAAGTATVTPATINAVPGATTTVNVTLKDNFSRAYANQTMSASVTGRNPTTVTKTALTDALGNASFTFTDANTTSVITSDNVSITGGSAAKTVTILYGTANAPSTITLTSTGDTDVIAGTTTTDIDASYSGATGKYATASAVVKNSAGSAVAGVAVTFTVSGLVGAEVHTTKATVYTDSTGTAVSYISSYAAGKAKVTATAGTATASDDIYFAQADASEARTISAVSNGSVVTATVKDRYGNPIKGVYVYATRTGTVYFGNGAGSSVGQTTADGTVDFIIGGGTGSVKVQLGDSSAASATFGQSYAAAGYDYDAVNGTAITASVAGTSATNQKGLGASLAPAGVNSASVEVDVANESANAVDAANEATDAANAATDAANAAAEAADAATAAAQDAQAAVAALATSVATLIAGIKAQITTLTNLVIKIQKKVRA